MKNKWLHLVSPGEFRQLPHLHCVGTASENSPSYSMEWENEPRCVFQYTLEGYGLISYGGSTYKVDRGKAFIFAKKAAGVRYYYPPKETAPWSFVYCEFCNFEDAVEQINSRHGPVYDLGKENYLARKLLALLEAQKQEETLMGGAESLRFCSEILEEMCRIVELKDRGKKGSLAIKARDLIFQRRMEPFSLPALAQSLGVCPEHLCREFKLRLNTSPKHYHDQLRVKLIGERLVNSPLPTKEIAHEFGYDNISNFIAFFKKHSGGVTPREFRRNPLS